MYCGLLGMRDWEIHIINLDSTSDRERLIFDGTTESQITVP